MQEKMKFSILIILLTISNVYSQDVNTNKLKFGVNVGANLFNLNQEQDKFFEDFNRKLGYTIGLSIEFKIHENLSLLSNINYDRKIIESNNFVVLDDFGNATSLNRKIKIKFSYINIPILIRYSFGANKSMYANAGGFYNHSINIKSKSVINETGENTSTFEYGDVIQDYDYGVSIGIGHKFNLTENNRFSIELRNDFGIANIAKEPSSISQTFTKLESNTIRLIVNWEIPL